MARKYWLMKSEPEVYSIQDLEKKSTHWDGVRNYQARNHMRDGMQENDLVLYYHSNAKPPGIAGVAKVIRTAYPDHTQFDKKSKYFDPKSTKEEPRWFMVDLGHVETFPAVLSLPDLKAAAELEGMLVIRKGMRLSVMPVEKHHFQAVLRLAKANHKMR